MNPEQSEPVRLEVEVLNDLIDNQVMSDPQASDHETPEQKPTLKPESPI